MTNHAFPEAWRRGLYETIARRRDMRAFLPDPIPHETLVRILSAANQAGSVGLSQPWNVLVGVNLDTRTQIRAHVEQERLRAAEAFSEERRAQSLSSKLEGILDAPINLCITCDQWADQPKPDLLRALMANEVEDERPPERGAAGAKGISE